MALWSCSVSSILYLNRPPRSLNQPAGSHHTPPLSFHHVSRGHHCTVLSRAHFGIDLFTFYCEKLFADPDRAATHLSRCTIRVWIKWDTPWYWVTVCHLSGMIQKIIYNCYRTGCVHAFHYIAYVELIVTLAGWWKRNCFYSCSAGVYNDNVTSFTPWVITHIEY